MAGGILGGIFLVSLIVFLVWWFHIRKRRAEQEAEWMGDEQKTRSSQINEDARSTRTRGSVTNSFFSRASNVIPIAYIPGVTNRNADGLESPVPPIPAQLRNGVPTRSPLSNKGDALFFRPESTYSAASSDTGVYRDDASEVPMPAQTLTRVAPRMVSVKSPQPSNASSEDSSESTEGAVRVAKAKPVTAKQVTVGKRSAEDAPLVQPADSPFFDSSERVSSSSSPTSPSASSSLRPNPYATMASTVNSKERTKRGRNLGVLSDIIEEATRRASRMSSDGRTSRISEARPATGAKSPFDDENAAQ
ncbi:hypothetical protein K470DRAFT_260771 [Piedraia hortae CBS 480.64]|uniref:Uncharacterized protein n=1 Tax=Piedraia hortae CBS 480.64 TaxID=1314780 RepID=A0A6A7BQC3_9PEZI|nr:hypothetical protein K470DRAFT_260771 [Piedraia hortae CBS 480.64]